MRVLYLQGLCSSSSPPHSQLLPRVPDALPNSWLLFLELLIFYTHTHTLKGLPSPFSTGHRYTGLGSPSRVLYVVDPGSGLALYFFRTLEILGGLVWIFTSISQLQGAHAGRLKTTPAWGPNFVIETLLPFKPGTDNELSFRSSEPLEDLCVMWEFVHSPLPASHTTKGTHSWAYSGVPLVLTQQPDPQATVQLPGLNSLLSIGTFWAFTFPGLISPLTFRPLNLAPHCFRGGRSTAHTRYAASFKFPDPVSTPRNCYRVHFKPETVLLLEFLEQKSHTCNLGISSTHRCVLFGLDTSGAHCV